MSETAGPLWMNCCSNTSLSYRYWRGCLGHKLLYASTSPVLNREDRLVFEWQFLQRGPDVGGRACRGHYPAFVLSTAAPATGCMLPATLTLLLFIELASASLPPSLPATRHPSRSHCVLGPGEGQRSPIQTFRLLSNFFYTAQMLHIALIWLGREVKMIT